METGLRSILKKFFGRYHHLTLLIVSQWPPWVMTSIGHDIVVMRTFHFLMRHRGHHDGAPDFTSGFHRGSCCPVMCLLISGYSLVFW